MFDVSWITQMQELWRSFVSKNVGHLGCLMDKAPLQGTFEKKLVTMALSFTLDKTNHWREYCTLMPKQFIVSYVA